MLIFRFHVKLQGCIIYINCCLGILLTLVHFQPNRLGGQGTNSANLSHRQIMIPSWHSTAMKLRHHIGVSKNNGIPKWMVYNGKPYEQMDDLGGFNPRFSSETSHIFHWMASNQETTFQFPHPPWPNSSISSSKFNTTKKAVSHTSDGWGCPPPQVGTVRGGTDATWGKVFFWLVVFQPIWKICSSNWIISPSRGENKRYLKPPTSKVLFFFGAPQNATKDLSDRAQPVQWCSSNSWRRSQLKATARRPAPVAGHGPTWDDGHLITPKKSPRFGHPLPATSLWCVVVMAHLEVQGGYAKVSWWWPLPASSRSLANMTFESLSLPTKF